MGPDHTSIRLRFTISFIWDCRAQSAVASRPIVKGDDVEIRVKLKKMHQRYEGEVEKIEYGRL
jgi:hypothetical protein